MSQDIVEVECMILKPKAERTTCLYHELYFIIWIDRYKYMQTNVDSLLHGMYRKR